METLERFNDHDESRIKPLMSPYLVDKSLNQIESQPERIFHAHLLSKALLKTTQSLTPRPSSNFDLEIVDQNTQLILLTFFSPF